MPSNRITVTFVPRFVAYLSFFCLEVLAGCSIILRLRAFFFFFLLAFRTASCTARHWHDPITTTANVPAIASVTAGDQHRTAASLPCQRFPFSLSPVLAQFCLVFARRRNWETTRTTSYFFPYFVLRIRAPSARGNVHKEAFLRHARCP